MAKINSVDLKTIRKQFEPPEVIALRLQLRATIAAALLSRYSDVTLDSCELSSLRYNVDQVMKHVVDVDDG